MVKSARQIVVNEHFKYHVWSIYMQGQPFGHVISALENKKRKEVICYLNVRGHKSRFRLTQCQGKISSEIRPTRKYLVLF